MLRGKLALVTGGARGIGAGIARVLAAQGARVAVLDLDGAEAEKTASGLDVPGMAVACDVAVEADTSAAVRSVVERFGGLDIVVNNAGVGRGATDPNVPRAAPGSLGADAMSAERWDEYLSQNLRTTFVTTKATLPHLEARGGGAIVLSVPDYAALDPRDVFLDVVKRGVPLGREQTPEDIGQLAAFLASDAARNITGQWIAVDGGITLRQAT